MGQPIVHFEIMGKDVNKLRTFYSELFGWKIAEPMGPEMGYYALVDGESSGLAGGLGQDPNGAVRTTFYVQVPDPQATVDQAVAKGGKVLMPPTEIPGANVTLAMFADPDGNVVGLTKG
jgi:uncharacterized protein